MPSVCHQHLFRILREPLAHELGECSIYHRQVSGRKILAEQSLYIIYLTAERSLHTLLDKHWIEVLEIRLGVDIL